MRSTRGRASQMTVEIMRQCVAGSPQPRITAKQIATIGAAARRLPGARVDGHPLVTAILWEGERAPALVQRGGTQWCIALDDVDVVMGSTLDEVLAELALPRPTITDADVRKVEAAFAKAGEGTIFHDERQITVRARPGDDEFEAAFTQRPKGWVLRMDGEWYPGKLDALLTRAWKRYAKLVAEVADAPEEAEDEDEDETDAATEPLDAKLQAELDDLPELRSWDVLRKPKRRGKRLLYLGDEGAPQARAVAWLRANEVALRDRLADLFFEAHTTGVGGLGTDFDEEDPPEVEGLIEMHRAFDVESVRVTVTEHRGVALVAVRVLTPWNKAHGLGLLLYQGKVVCLRAGEATEADALEFTQRAERGRPPAKRSLPMKTPRLASWKKMLAKDADRPLVTVHLADGRRTPSAEQRDALAYLEAHDAEIRAKVLAAILAEYWGWTWREKEEDEERLASYRLPAVDDVGGLSKVVRLERVVVSPVEKGPHAYVGFAFTCAWLPFSGLGVLVLEGDVVEVGGIDVIAREAVSGIRGRSAAEARRHAKEREFARDPWWAEKPAPFRR